GIACIMAGYESEPARVCARLARLTRSDLKSTVLGYGLTTSPELAAFANTSMYRHADFDINGHVGDLIPGVLAVGEAFHAPGARLRMGATQGKESDAPHKRLTAGTGGSWDNPFLCPATAMPVGKLMAPAEDQLANALSLAMVPPLPMKVTHVGAL